MRIFEIWELEKSGEPERTEILEKVQLYKSDDFLEIMAFCYDQNITEKCRSPRELSELKKSLDKGEELQFSAFSETIESRVIVCKWYRIRRYYLIEN